MIAEHQRATLNEYFQKPPNIPLPEVEQFIAHHFKNGKLTRLDGERDQNYRLEIQDGRKFVVKISQPDDDGHRQVVDQARALQHIADAADLPVPKLHAREIIDFEGATYPVLVLDWLDGEVIGEQQLSFAQYQLIGHKIGELTKALRGFNGPAIAGRQLVWHTGEFLTPSFFDGWEKLLAPDSVQLINQVKQQHSTLKLHALPAQIIHGDVHPYNTLLNSEGAVSGIIDFGDMVHASRVIDISNALADFLLPDSDFEKIINALVSGYVKATPLEEAEVDVILPLIQSRLALSTVVTAFRRQLGAIITPQIAALNDISLTVLRQLRSANLEASLRHAAGFTARASQSAANIHQRRISVMGPKPLLFYDPPLHMVKGEGVWLTASDGRRYLDCYNNVPHVGHSHPVVAEAVARQIRKLNTNTRYLTAEAIEYAERLTATVHPSLDTVIFVNSGSEANDVAIRMAKTWTGNSGALCMDFAYHGVTEATDAISPSNYPQGKWNMPHVRMLEAPDGYRGPIKHGAPNFVERYAAYADTALNSLKHAGLGCAYAIIDSAFMTNGILDVPSGYVSALVKKTHAAGGLFIADEVQSGFGRMGTAMWGHAHHGVVPDFVTIGKPAGNGFPLGVIITRAEILEKFTAATGPLFSTFGGNNVACAAGLAVLDIIAHEKLVVRARSTGDSLRAQLRLLMQRHEIIGDVRGVGLATGVELVRNRKTLEPASTETRALLNLIRNESVLVGSDGKTGNVLKIRPPLALAPEHVPILTEALDRALQRLASK
jgi:4-aminobutyrate aminotransferase-like enzyme/aminoglycoside phosphotransferase (APT) family kinase protein